MKYEPSEQTVPQNKRKEFNEKILYLIDSGKTEEFGITGADIYNLYTGDGGLHGLKRSDYSNYSEYSKGYPIKFCVNKLPIKHDYPWPARQA